MDELLLQEVSPNGNLQATLESDGRTCFLYLSGPPDSGFGVRTVWVRNLVDASEQLDVSGMRDGSPPVLPAEYCRNISAQPLPQTDQLRFVWLPEGNGVAVFEDDDVLAIIPPWSGTDGFDGYARDCVGESPIAWKLDAENVLHSRFNAAAAYWQVWDDGEFWNQTQDSQIAALEKCLGQHTNYYAIDGEEWPPKAMLRFRSSDWQALVTIGVSLRPQPNVDVYFKDPGEARRIEIAVALPADLPDDDVRKVGGYLSAQSGLPWANYTCLGTGHTIPCDSWPDSRYSATLLTDTSPIERDPQFEPLFGDPVNLIWMLPITEAEREVAMAQTSAVLFDRLPHDRWRCG